MPLRSTVAANLRGRAHVAASFSLSTRRNWESSRPAPIHEGVGEVTTVSDIEVVQVREAALNRVTEIASHRMCICGHKRRDHVHCSENYPALCTYEVAPGEDYPICSCLDFEEDV